MGRKGRRTPPEVARQWAEAHRAGESFKAIGEREGVERRTVARAVRRFQEAASLEEAAGARRMVAADYLKQHFAELQYAARFLLQITAPSSITGRHFPFREFNGLERGLLDRLEEWAFRDRMGYRVLLDGERSVVELDQPAHARALDRISAGTEARAIWNSLREHLPRVEAKLHSLVQSQGDAEREKVYQELGQMLTPPELQKQLLATRCRYCPAP